MPAGLTIRRAMGADRAAVEALNAELQAHEVPIRPSRAAPEDLPRAYVDALYALRRRGWGDLLVARRKGRVIGFVAYEWGEDVLERDPPEVTVTDLVVTATERGQGVGRALVAAVEAAARARGVRRLYVITLAENRATHAAYAAMGMRVTLVHFEKDLDPALDPDPLAP